MAKRKKKAQYGGLFTILKILLAFGLTGLILAVFVLCERFVNSEQPHGTGPLIFENMPKWVDEALLSEVYAAIGGSRTFQLDENMASLVVEGLDAVAWLDQVEARVTHRDIKVHAQWRKPLARVKTASTEFYVDTDGVVLDPIALDLPIVTIQGVRVRQAPAAGTVLEKDDLFAALGLIFVLDQMDKLECPGKPLLAEIDRVDITNFQGRDNLGDPHIVLVTKDETPIHWGAELKAGGTYLEQTDRTKLASLYTYYKECGTLLGENAKYINLRDSRREIPLP
jgi:hypothetical protein